MPPKSQMQQGLGTGGLASGNSFARGFGGPQAGVQPAPGMDGPSNPYDLGDAFNRYYGGMPTHALVSGMQNGQPPQPVAGPSLSISDSSGQDQPSVASAGGAGPPTAGGGGNPQQPGPTATPAHAGKMNATMPGTFNGNPANGIPSAEAGFAGGMRRPPMPAQPPAPPPQPVNGMASSLASPAPAAPDPGPPDQHAMSTGLAAGAQEQPTEMPGAPGEMEAKKKQPKAPPPPVEFSAPPPPVTASVDPTTGATTTTPGTPPAATPETPAPPPVDPNAKAGGADPVHDFKHWFHGHTDSNLDLSGLPPPSQLGITIPNDIADSSTLGQSGGALASQPALAGLAYTLQKLNIKLQQLVGGGAGAGQVAEEQAKYNQIRDFLKSQYGVSYDPQAPASAGPGGPPGGGTGPGGSDTVPGSAAGLVGAGNQYIQLQRQHPELKQWELEYIAQLAETNAANQRYDNANQTIGSAVNKFENNPLADKSRHMAEGLLDNPDNTPWDTVKNQYAANADKDINSSLGSLSDSLNRRGVGPSTGAGITADTLRQSAGDRAMGLGQLDVQQAKSQQDAEYRAMAAAGDVGQLWDTGALNARIAQANFQRGAPQSAISPFEGFGDSWVNQHAMDLADKAADYDQSFTWEDGAALYANLASSAAKAYAGGA